MKQVLRYGLTGGIASGKDVVAEVFRRKGWRVLDADDVVHELEAPGGLAVEPIRELFGAEVLAPNGGVARQVLAERVFGDLKARRALEDLLHPMVRERVKGWFEASDGGYSLAVVPLLFECAMEPDFDVVMTVSSEPEEQVARLVTYRGFTEAAARARIAAQLPLAVKEAMSDYVIPNHGSVEELKLETEALIERLIQKDRR